MLSGLTCQFHTRWPMASGQSFILQFWLILIGSPFQARWTNSLTLAADRLGFIRANEVKVISIILKWVCSLTDSSCLEMLAKLTKEGNLVETGQWTQILFHFQIYNLDGKSYFVNGSSMPLNNQTSRLHLPLQMPDLLFSKTCPFQMEPANLILL